MDVEFEELFVWDLSILDVRIRFGEEFTVSFWFMQLMQVCYCFLDPQFILIFSLFASLPQLQIRVLS